MKFFLRASMAMLAVVAVALASVSLALAQATTHIVQPGQTLYSIARQYGVTPSDLAFANGITNPDRIFVGQTLVIPGAAIPSTGTTATPATGQPATHTVQAGETLFGIARRYGVTVNTLVTLNNITDSNRITVGLVLRLPGGASTATPAATSAVTSTPGTAQPTATAGTPAATTAAPTAAPTQGGTAAVYHTVQAGETLYRIALRYGTTYQAIAQLNGLDASYRIFVGQNLLIRPASGAAPTAAPTATRTPAPGTPTATRTPSPVPTTAVPGATAPAATATPAPSATPVSPTATSVAAATTDPGQAVLGAVAIPASAPNRFFNPGFEGTTRGVIFGEVNVFESWEPFYCDQPYTTSKCPAERLGTGNPVDLKMGRPEYKPSDVANRIHSGVTSQQWFCFYRTCRAGVFQTVSTTPGAVCEVTAYVQSWSGTGYNFLSEVSTEDARLNSQWFIAVDRGGATDAFAPGVLRSRAFTYYDSHYDKYVQISYRFQATGTRTTIFFENLRLWPIPNNDNYLDDVSVRCNS
ncbi:MAG: LysM peptidoglycan-binding domain-containing protein [Anaerolineae bacterium]|nr:LysM peptidoglycan-binding domain-containing protein [Anaerolineae bacterium]